MAYKKDKYERELTILEESMCSELEDLATRMSKPTTQARDLIMSFHYLDPAPKLSEIKKFCDFWVNLENMHRTYPQWWQLRNFIKRLPERNTNREMGCIEVGCYDGYIELINKDTGKYEFSRKCNCYNKSMFNSIKETHVRTEHQKSRPVTLKQLEDGRILKGEKVRKAIHEYVGGF